MSSAARSVQSGESPQEIAPLAWRSWPLADHRRWSWVVPLGIVAGGGWILWLGGWLIAVAAVLGLTATLWQFLLSVHYELTARGIRRKALGRTKLTSWHEIRAYNPRPTGIVFYRRSDPVHIDLLNSLFVPYPPDPDDLLTFVRQHLSHATELPPA